MKKKFFSVAIALVCILVCGVCLSGCIFESVVPCAWVRLDMEGYIYYSATVYGGDHICYYENAEDAENDRYHANCSITVTFFPRILGADTVDGVRTTTVDISRSYSMMVYVYKNKSIYSAEKKIYLNGQELQYSNVNDLENLVCYTFDNFTFVRGNPNGQANGFVNTIEYK